MFKKLIILSLTFLLISCGEEEEVEAAPQPESKVATQPKAADQQPQTPAEAPQPQSPTVVPQPKTPAVDQQPQPSVVAQQPQTPAEAPQPQSPAVVPQPESQEEVITKPPAETEIATNNEDIQEEPLEDYSDVIDIELPEEALAEELPKVQPQSPAEAPQLEIAQVNEEGTFLVYNGSTEMAVLKTISGWFWPEHSEVIPPNECVRIHNRHLGNISIRGDSFLASVTPDWLPGTVCKKSECPQGDTIIKNASSEQAVIVAALTEDVMCSKVSWLP